MFENMIEHRGAAYGLARAIIVGAVAASAWFALESLLPMPPFPLPVYAVPIIGASGGAVWYLLGRVPLRGRIWYYCRWIVVTSVAYVPLLFDAGPVDLVTALFEVAVVVGSGIGLGYYAQSFLGKDEDSAK